MRGKDEQQLDVFSYVNSEQRVPQDHPLRPLRFIHHRRHAIKHEINTLMR